MTKIELKVNNKKYAGWENVRIDKDMTSICDKFEMEIFNGMGLSVAEGDFVQILKDDAVFFTGYVDTYDIDIGDKKNPLKLTGRSKTCDLVDCNIENFNQYSSQNQFQIISDIIKDFNIKISYDIELEVVETFETKIGETFFEAINRLCKQTNILPVSDRNGNLVLTKNTNKSTGRSLKDKDLKSIKFTADITKVFSKYTYKKEDIYDDQTDGSVTDKTVKRYRPFVDENTHDKPNIELAKWKMNNSIANAIQLEISIDNWDYDINTIIQIDSQVVKNSYLIKTISYKKGNNGTMSTLALVGKDLFNVRLFEK